MQRNNVFFTHGEKDHRHGKKGEDIWEKAHKQKVANFSLPKWPLVSLWEITQKPLPILWDIFSYLIWSIYAICKTVSEASGFESAEIIGHFYCWWLWEVSCSSFAWVKWWTWSFYVPCCVSLFVCFLCITHGQGTAQTFLATGWKNTAPGAEREGIEDHPY